MSGTPVAVMAEGDLSALARIHAASFSERWNEIALRDMLTMPGTSAFSTPDGFIMVRVAADEAEILTLAVAPAARRRGTGSALVFFACAHAQRAGARSMFLEAKLSNASALSLYRRLGFREVGLRKAYYGGGEDALVLRVDLPIIPLGNPRPSITVAAKPRGSDRDAD